MKLYMRVTHDQMKKTFKPLLVIKEDKSEENPYKVRYVSDVFISFGEED